MNLRLFVNWALFRLLSAAYACGPPSLTDVFSKIRAFSWRGLALGLGTWDKDQIIRANTWEGRNEKVIIVFQYSLYNYNQLRRN